MSSNKWHQPDLNPGLQGVSSQLSPLPSEIYNLIWSEVKYDMIALRLKLMILCFPQILSRSLQWVRQSALHCTTEAMTIHNNQSSIKRIYMTLKCMCVFLLFPSCFFSWRPIKNDSVTPCFFSWRPIKNDSVTPYGFFHDDRRKTTVSTLMFHLIKTTVIPLMLFSHDDWWKIIYLTRTIFFSWRPINNNSGTPVDVFAGIRTWAV